MANNLPPDDIGAENQPAPKDHLRNEQDQAVQNNGFIGDDGLSVSDRDRTWKESLADRASGAALAGKINPHHHFHSARLLLHQHRFKESVKAVQPPALRHSIFAGLQAGLTILIALPLLLFMHWDDYIGYAALGSLVGLFGRFAPRHRRPMILLHCALLLMSAIFSMSLITYLGANLWAQLALLCLGCGLFLYINLRMKFGPPGALIFIFSFAPAMAPVENVNEIIIRTVATGSVGLLALLICWITDPLRMRNEAETAMPLLPDLSAKICATMGLRAVVGAICAVAISQIWNAAHPAWAAMGALAVLQGTQLHINMHRALQRMVGTMIGALVAWQLLLLEPSIWTMIWVLVFLQLVTETVIGYNYAFGQIFITPMALLLTQMAAGSGHAAEMATERVWDTIAGVVIGMAIAWLLSTLDDRRVLAEHQQSIMRSS